jgi:hypothetical protein
MMHPSLTPFRQPLAATGYVSSPNYPRTPKALKLTSRILNIASPIKLTAKRNRRRHGYSHKGFVKAQSMKPALLA